MSAFIPDSSWLRAFKYSNIDNSKSGSSLLILNKHMDTPITLNIQQKRKMYPRSSGHVEIILQVPDEFQADYYILCDSSVILQYFNLSLTCSGTSSSRPHFKSNIKGQEDNAQTHQFRFIVIGLADVVILW